ncbi:histidine phosphatase family protein [Croceicoccus estronivorus]|uniref:SixA phosphatase family protein n=1 Tax=Croceicoccus estronivorus TaxID=1172626 RepID=UPI00082BF30C|nr:histidine phosphatase family protein [Croceicoccus estronivorus]OCC22726.1 histidine phosphatase family protein [Croceicoccus estronivorus]
MKRLGLFRHAKSSWEDMDLRDFDRALNKRGRRGATLMGQHIGEHGVPWDILIASPAVRVRETLESAIPAMASPPPVTWDERLYLANVPTMLDVLRHVEGQPANIILAAHNPGLQDMLFELIPESAQDAKFDEAVRKFPTAAFAVIELDIDDWADIERGCGRMVHFARPRDLDPTLGPEEVP